MEVLNIALMVRCGDWYAPMTSIPIRLEQPHMDTKSRPLTEADELDTPREVFAVLLLLLCVVAFICLAVAGLIWAGFRVFA